MRRGAARGIPLVAAVVVGFTVWAGLRPSSGPNQALAALPACTITGTDTADHLVGTSGNDVICAGAGDDFIAGKGGDDLILGEEGNDTIKGGDGRDVIRGGAGNDLLQGGGGADEVRGQDGNDHAAGGGGHDRIFGGSGSDQLGSRDRHPYDKVDGGTGTNLCVVDSSDSRRGCNHSLDPAHRRGVPILMYHVIAEPTSSTPLAYLWVAPRAFAAQMRWLHQHHYHVVTLQEVYDYWHGAPLPYRPIVVSFDDGFRNHLSKAMPILDHHHWEGTLNLALSHYNQRGWGLGPRAIHILLNHDWELDSHTMTHVSLPGLSDTQLQYQAIHLNAQVAHSRSLLRNLFHVPVDFFCYPAGAYDSRVIAYVKTAGYQAATSTEDGLAHRNDLWALNRVRVNGGDGVTGLARHLRALGLPG